MLLDKSAAPSNVQAPKDRLDLAPSCAVEVSSPPAASHDGRMWVKTIGACILATAILAAAIVIIIVVVGAGDDPETRDTEWSPSGGYGSFCSNYTRGFDYQPEKCNATCASNKLCCPFDDTDKPAFVPSGFRFSSSAYRCVTSNCTALTEGCATAGRPFLDMIASKPVTATLQKCTHQTTHGDTHSDPVASPSDVDTRRAIARSYLDQGLAEHASVASFARFTLQLMALGAPETLLAASSAAAADEVRHAKLCFATAAEYDNETQRLEPGPFPFRDGVVQATVSLQDLAETTTVEGVIGETVAAIEMAVRARHANISRSTAAMLERMAADEARHSALAWHTLFWAHIHNPGMDMGPIWKAVDNSLWTGVGDFNSDEATNAFGNGQFGVLDGQEIARIRDASVRAFVKPLLQLLPGSALAGKPLHGLPSLLAASRVTAQFGSAQLDGRDSIHAWDGASHGLSLVIEAVANF